MTLRKNVFITISKHRDFLLEYESLREKCPYSEFLCSVFSSTRTEYGEPGPYTVQMR